MHLEHYKFFQDDPFYGHYIVARPVIMLKDLALIKAVLVKDFDHFTDRNPITKGVKRSKTDEIWIKQVQ